MHPGSIYYNFFANSYVYQGPSCPFAETDNTDLLFLQQFLNLSSLIFSELCKGYQQLRPRPIEHIWRGGWGLKVWSGCYGYRYQQSVSGTHHAARQASGIQVLEKGKGGGEVNGGWG